MVRALVPFRRAAGAAATPRCELCAAAIGEPHAHVLELAGRTLRCACRACAILFRDAGAGGGRYRTLPERVRADGAFAPAEEAWAALGVPVGLAFFVRRRDGWVASYPSPAGAVEAPLAEAAVGGLEALTPLAAALEPELEALLVRRRRDGGSDCYLVPLDVCYELVGVIRREWRGFDGGDEARGHIEALFARLGARAERGS